MLKYHNTLNIYTPSKSTEKQFFLLKYRLCVVSWTSYLIRRFKNTNLWWIKTVRYVNKQVYLSEGCFKIGDALLKLKMKKKKEIPSVCIQPVVFLFKTIHQNQCEPMKYPCSVEPMLFHFIFKSKAKSSRTKFPTHKNLHTGRIRV